MAFTFTISNLVVARAADNIRRHSRTDHLHHEAIINGHEATGLEDYEPPLAAVRAAEQAEHEFELQESHSSDPVIPLTPPNPKPSKRVGVIAKELMHEIYMDDDPMSHPPGIKPDWSYGHTNFQTGVFNALLDMYVPKLRFYLEVGSFKAGSIVLAANELKRRGQHDVSRVAMRHDARNA
ncbi:BTRC protein [Pseudoscourfieldia marina]